MFEHKFCAYLTGTDTKTCDKSGISRKAVLDQIASVAKKAKPDKDGFKYLAIYYTGHGEHGTGNWVFSDGVIKLQDIYDVCTD